MMAHIHCLILDGSDTFFLSDHQGRMLQFECVWFLCNKQLFVRLLLASVLYAIAVCSCFLFFRKGLLHECASQKRVGLWSYMKSTSIWIDRYHSGFTGPCDHPENLAWSSLLLFDRNKDVPQQIMQPAQSISFFLCIKKVPRPPYGHSLFFHVGTT